jgi:tRNA A-37 threonylcarbamoyl transferase component Bud32
MHNAGVDHSDLNCRNILIDAQDKVWLIDFDKCQRRGAGHWRAKNLERLKRSLRKEQAKGAGLHWSQGDWEELLAGYESAKSDGAEPER